MDLNNPIADEILHSVYLLEEVAEQLKTLSEVTEIVLELAKHQLEKSVF